MYGSGWVSLTQRIMPLECDPTRIPSSSRKWVQVSTQARSPIPTWLVAVTSSSTRLRVGVSSWAAAFRCAASPTPLGAIITPSEPCSRTPKMISASSASCATVIRLPVALAAAAITISSGILVGSRKSSRLSCSLRADSHASSRLSASTISTKRPKVTSG